MKFKPHVRRAFIYLGIFVLFLVLMSFVESKQRNRICRNAEVQIVRQYGNYFIDQTDVLKILSQNGKEPVIGKPQKKIVLKELERRLKTNHFVKNCQISRNLNGDLVIFIEQNRPIARLVTRSGDDKYISENGLILPVSDNYTARVLPIEVKNRKLLENPALLAKPGENGISYLNVLKFIDENKFWKAQIAQLLIQENGNILLFPQVGKQTIEFGTAENFEEKFKKLDIFYRQIIPEKGWNRYERINVAYENQIICE